ncbi:MAG TPA: hypothetical protein VF418_12395 [Sphingomonadaceae bacterium]
MSLRSFLLLTFVCLLWAANTIVGRLAVGTLSVLVIVLRPSARIFKPLLVRSRV